MNDWREKGAKRRRWKMGVDGRAIEADVADAVDYDYGDQ